MIINKASSNKKLKNSILAIASEATKAKKIDPEVINATAGMLKNEEGELYEFSCVEKVIANLSTSDKYAYANSSGTPSYAKAVYIALFGKYYDELIKDTYLECVSTPGGSGAITLAFTNYLDQGDTVLLPNHMWENYLNFATETGLNTLTYRLFNDQDSFDIDDLTNKIDSLKNKQKTIMILVNDPCENPTGFCMEDEDYDRLIDVAKNNPNNNFVYFMDVAYYDFYNTNPDIIRKRYIKLKDVPSNALVLFAFSGSKSFGLYGLRIGALVCMSKNKEEVLAFKDANDFSCRAKWSSSSKLGISIIEKLVLDDNYRHSYEEEVKNVCSMLESRSVAFLNSSKEVGLRILPYQRGFFICVACKNPVETMVALREDKVYVIATKSCLRIALCGINKEEAMRLPKIIKNRLDKMEQ